MLNRARRGVYSENANLRGKQEKLTSFCSICGEGLPELPCKTGKKGWAWGSERWHWWSVGCLEFSQTLINQSQVQQDYVEILLQTVPSGGVREKKSTCKKLRQYK